jgi:predicted RNase H-like HicB family nuclease
MPDFAKSLLHEGFGHNNNLERGTMRYAEMVAAYVRADKRRNGRSAPAERWQKQHRIDAKCRQTPRRGGFAETLRAMSRCYAGAEAVCHARQVNILVDINSQLSITINRDEDGVWVAECPALPGCVSQGVTKTEAVKNIREAIALCLEVRAQCGFPLPTMK